MPRAGLFARIPRFYRLYDLLAACRRDKHFYNMNRISGPNWPLIPAEQA